MKEIITHPQKSDMGSGFGYYELDDKMTLEQVLNFIKNNERCWGDITIYKNNKIVRRFDYDLYNKSILYCYSGFEKDYVETVKFDYCFMRRDFEIVIL